MKKLIIYCQGDNDCCEIQDENGNDCPWDELTAQEQRSLINAMSNIYDTLEVNCKEGGEQ